MDQIDAQHAFRRQIDPDMGSDIQMQKTVEQAHSKDHLNDGSASHQGKEACIGLSCLREIQSESRGGADRQQQCPDKDLAAIPFKPVPGMALQIDGSGSPSV